MMERDRFLGGFHRMTLAGKQSGQAWEKSAPRLPGGKGQTGLSAAQLLFQGQLSPKKQKKIVKLDQWVEVRVTDGVTKTTLYPENDLLIRRGQKMLPPPEFVYRRINFPDGIPPEYWWACASGPERRVRGGMGTQRMTVETWLAVIAREALRSDGHIGPTGIGNLPRPEQYGGCECVSCRRGVQGG